MLQRDASTIILVPAAANDNEPGLIIPLPKKPVGISQKDKDTFIFS